MEVIMVTGVKKALLGILALFSGILSAKVDPDWGGNKHKNLVILQDILKNTPNTLVPVFICVPTGRVEWFLREQWPGVLEYYAEVVARLNGQTDLDQDFAQVTTEYLLSTIQNGIKSILTSRQWQFSQEEKDFFAQVAQKGGYLMVRSSGVEDNAGAANAGGNASIAYVEPTEDAVRRAMGEVVASYFGLQSLKNRVAGGEKLTDELVIPVLIQELVGEAIGGSTEVSDIPVSGVAYTTNQNLSDTTFKVTEINASYGHGEGIVANKVMADRYFITKSNNATGINIYPMLYHKKERLVPSGNEKKLIAKANDKSLANAAALTKKQISSLYAVLQKIEQAYGQPMDVEFVLLKEKVYIVQARPAMHTPANPSYFDVEKMNIADASDPINAITLVPGTGSLQCITNSEDIIVTKTLDQADQMQNSVSAKAVIVSTWASSLSHAAVNFMSHGTPCLYVQNIKQIEKELAQVSSSCPVIIDTQRGVIYFWKNERVSPQRYILNGWFEHPIERNISLFTDNMMVLPQIKNPMPKDAKLMQLMTQLKKSNLTMSERKELLDAACSRVDAYITLTECRVLKTGYLLSAQARASLDIFKNTYAQYVQEYKAAIARRATHFELLFHHKMLEALLYQLDGTGRLLAGYTYAYFLNDIFQKQGVQRIAQAKNIQHVRELEYASYCPTKELSQKWIDFITQLDACADTMSIAFKEQVIQFDAFMHSLEQSNNLSLWFATAFYQASKEIAINSDFVVNLIASTAQQHSEHQSFCDDVIAYQEKITSMRSKKGNGFARAADARATWTELKEALIDPMTSDLFVSNFHEASPTVQLIACGAMGDLIDVVDATIKELKVSTQILVRDRIAIFKEMLGDFKTMFKVWITEIMPQEALEYHYNWPLDTYLARVENIYTEIMQVSDDESMFKKSSTFGVDAAVLGSGTAFERHYPQTAEDMFMLIHQNTLAAVAGTIKQILGQKPLRDMLCIPELLISAKTELEANADIGMKMIGISFDANKTTLSYNIPLQNHSATLQLHYDNNLQECSCAVQFLGESRSRWEQVAALARMSQQLSGLDLVDEVFFDETAGVISWQWIIKNKEQLPIIGQCLIIMKYLSFGHDLNLEHLRAVYQGAERDATIKKIVRNYMQQFGSFYALEQIVDVDPNQVAVVSPAVSPVQRVVVNPPMPIRTFASRLMRLAAVATASAVVGGALGAGLAMVFNALTSSATA